MDNLWVVVVFFLVLSIIFFIFGIASRRNEDAGSASTHTAIGLILIIITVILFLVMVNMNHLYEDKGKDDTPYKMILHNDIHKT
jgi:heme/copper-type cytochrome/quinol oxidase subunit 2